jgi:uncharacterized protein YndB with AHSA1/START domain
MRSTTETAVLTREIVIAAAPETVWQYLVDPDRVTRWMGRNISFDPQPGGQYRMEVGSGHAASGEFVELDPPRRLVYTWGWEAVDGKENAVPPGSSTVEVELVAEPGGTRLRLTHRDLPTVEAADSHGSGWDHYLERLVIAAAGTDPGPDPWETGQM